MAVVINGITSSIENLSTAVAVDDISPLIVIGSNTITGNSASQYIIGIQTRFAGGSAIVDKETTYSLAASGTAVGVNSVSYQISTSTDLTADDQEPYPCRS